MCLFYAELSRTSSVLILQNTCFLDVFESSSRWLVLGSDVGLKVLVIGGLILFSANHNSLLKSRLRKEIELVVPHSRIL